MVQASIRKFTFDNDFDRPITAAKSEPEKIDIPPAAEPPAPTFSEEELSAAAAAARKAALSEGIAQGRAEAVSQNERQIAAALGAIASQLAAIDKDVHAAADDITETAVELSMQMVRKLFPELARRHGVGEVGALVMRCMESLKAEPRLAARVSERHFEEIREKMDDAASERGFEGKLSVVADAALKAGDCRLEWAQGGLIRTGADIWSGIEAALEQALASIDTDSVETTGIGSD